MKYIIKFTCLALLSIALLISSAFPATLNTGSGVLNLEGANYDYSNIMFSSITAESGASAELIGDSLIVNFMDFAAESSGSGFKVGLASGKVGFEAVASNGRDLNRFEIKANGTFGTVASIVKSSFAEAIAQVPVILQVLGVNGIPFARPDMTGGFNMTVLPESVLVQQTDVDRSESGIWAATWSTASLGEALNDYFNAPTMKITELMVAITPDLSVFAENGTSTMYLQQIMFAPIPEPSVASLMLVGGVVWVVRSRRRS